MLGIGIDTGGTYTDAVIYDSDTGRILDVAKHRTTREDLTICIREVLDHLDERLLQRAEMIALSTTLATNACLEDKGGRSRCLMIGVDEEMAKSIADVHLGYGFKDEEQILYMSGKPEHIFSNAEEPDWEKLEAHAAEWFENCRCVAVTQIYPEANGARFEKRAKEIIERTTGIPVTTGWELSRDVDMMKRGAATFLNARLIPLVADFMEAVGAVLEERGLHIPVAIVTSDGSLLPRSLAAESPVTTLLSGPAASAVGGSVLAEGQDAVVVDMGGTTTDIALVRGGEPIMSESGISIGQWKTTVKGLYVDTTLLGGDSAVRFADGRIVLSGDRVIPLSVLAETHPEIASELKTLGDAERKHTRMLHEFMVLQRRDADASAFTAEELAICRALEDGPLRIEALAERLGLSIYTLKTERLEEEGVLIRSGLTPTDMMVLKGDIDFYDGTAAREALRFVAENVKLDEDQIPNEVYRIVEKKLYCRIAGILLDRERPEKFRYADRATIDTMLGWAFDDTEKKAEEKKFSWVESAFHTDLPIVGVGAPTHVFLAHVAKKLGTTAVISPYSEVANALGAISGKVVTRVDVRVKADYIGATPDGFSVMDGEEKVHFEHYDEAEAFGVALAKRMALAKAERKGLVENRDPLIEKREIRNSGLLDVFFETVVTASVIGRIV